MDKKAFAESVGLDGRALGGMITQMKTNSKIPQDLKKLSYADDQIPDWVPDLQPDQLPEAPPDAAPKPENAPIRIAQARKMGATSMDASMHGQLACQLPASQSAAAFDAANRMLEPGGRRIESLGSDALARWMQENGVEERYGVYWQRTTLPSGQVALVQVQPPKEELEEETLGVCSYFLNKTP